MLLLLISFDCTETVDVVTALAKIEVGDAVICDVKPDGIPVSGASTRYSFSDSSTLSPVAAFAVTAVPLDPVAVSE
jgi:hypothetical protein